MLLYKNKIVVTGGSGRFASVLKKTKTKYNLFFPTKKQLNILKPKTINKYLKVKKPKYVIHLAGLSRPMKIHRKNIRISIRKIKIIRKCVERYHHLSEWCCCIDLVVVVDHRMWSAGHRPHCGE